MRNLSSFLCSLIILCALSLRTKAAVNGSSQGIREGDEKRSIMTPAAGSQVEKGVWEAALNRLWGPSNESQLGDTATSLHNVRRKLQIPTVGPTNPPRRPPRGPPTTPPPTFPLIIRSPPWPSRRPPRGPPTFAPTVSDSPSTSAYPTFLTRGVVIEEFTVETADTIMDRSELLEATERYLTTMFPQNLYPGFQRIELVEVVADNLSQWTVQRKRRHKGMSTTGRYLQIQDSITMSGDVIVKVDSNLNAVDVELVVRDSIVAQGFTYETFISLELGDNAPDILNTHFGERVVPIIISAPSASTSMVPSDSRRPTSLPSISSAPTSSTMPSSTPSSSFIPTLSSTPTQTGNPSHIPSLSNVPSNSLPPSSAPSLTLNPTSPVVVTDTNAILYLTGSSSLIADQARRESLENGLMVTYNTLNGNSLLGCDAFARRIINVTIDTTQTNPNRRMLQQRNLQYVEILDTSQDEDLLEERERFLANEAFTVFFRIEFECSGECTQSTTLFEDSFVANPIAFQQECGSMSQPQTGFSYFDFRDSFFQLVRSSFGPEFVSTIENLWEVVATDCNPQVFVRRTNITLRDLNISLLGSTPLEEQAFTTAFVRSYNTVVQSNLCDDEFFRVALNASIVDTTTEDDMERRRLRVDRPPSFSPITAVIGIDFKCRKCPEGTGLLLDDAGRRRDLEAEDPPQSRMLQETDLCFCPLIIRPPPPPSLAPSVAPVTPVATISNSPSFDPNAPFPTPQPSFQAIQTPGPEPTPVPVPPPEDVVALTLSTFSNTLAALGF